MAPYKTTRSNNVPNSNSKVSFLSKGTEGENVEKIICTPKYISVAELKKPAVVTDRLRRDYADLKSFDRISMKCGVRKILNLRQVVDSVNNYQQDEDAVAQIPGSTAFSHDNGDSLVSEFCYKMKARYYK